MRKWINITEVVVLVAILVFVIGFHKYYSQPIYIDNRWINVNSNWEADYLSDMNELNMPLIEISYDNPVVGTGIANKIIGKAKLVKIINDNRASNSESIRFVQASISEIKSYLDEVKTRKTYMVTTEDKSVNMSIGDLLLLINKNTNNSDLHPNCTYIDDNGYYSSIKLFLAVNKGITNIRIANDADNQFNSQMTIEVRVE